ncbi:dienelactone hydrolase family protein [Mobilicoccus pelagius]|uniref:Putative hydrolase n=1 Tax=Mobilicoccus pelagius NBRC 104925 TaxID=1089455 RepID=H5UW48_9MICO|nr:dienelactone hydrolase family protein [Mobilicoccus pelagius]GAB49956.1 putative hydrolase [Mobilicoccus pelagius NBRC 104925]
MNEMLTITTDAGRAEAYLTRPDAQERPGVLMFMDAIGVRERTKEMADRIASWGYVVLLPNVFYREGTVAELAPDMDLTDPEQRKEFGEISGPRVKAYTPDLSNPDTQAWFDTLGQYASTPYGTVGFCMGARLAIRAAALHPDDVAAVAGFHGANLVEDDAEDSPHLLLPRTNADYLFGHADNDTMNDADAVAELERRLEQAGLTYSSAIYPDAPHGFTMADTSSYQDMGEKRAFAELEPFFARTLQR